MSSRGQQAQALYLHGVVGSQSHRAAQVPRPADSGAVPASCLPGCLAHREHVYILCYGTPTVIKEGDCGERPVTHYVGYTQQQPPLKRVWQHGRGSARALVQIRPGTMRDEARAKCLGRCPRCGKRLWYFAGKWPSAAVLAAGGLFISPRENHVRLRPCYATFSVSA